MNLPTDVDVDDVDDREGERKIVIITSNMHTIIQFYSLPDADNRVYRQRKRIEIIKNRNMHTIILLYSPTDVGDRVDREGENK